MSKLAKATAFALSVAAVFYAMQEEKPISAPWIAEECTESLEVECVVDI